VDALTAESVPRVAESRRLVASAPALINGTPSALYMLESVENFLFIVAVIECASFVQTVSSIPSGTEGSRKLVGRFPSSGETPRSTLRYCYCHIVTRPMLLVKFNCESGTALGLGNYDLNLSTIRRLDTGFTELCVKLTGRLESADWMVASKTC
jgi:hypothetical protein